MKIATITFDYEDFNNTTHRSTDMRRHGTAELHQDIGGGRYVNGDMGCGKTRESVSDALKEYLGGRTLLGFRIYERA